MQIHRLLKNIRNLLFVFISVNIIVAGVAGPLDASNQKISSVSDSSFKSFIKQVNQNYGKQYPSHVEELFHTLLKPEKTDPSEEGSRFLEFDVIKRKIIYRCLGYNDWLEDFFNTWELIRQLKYT